MKQDINPAQAKAKRQSFSGGDLRVVEKTTILHYIPESRCRLLEEEEDMGTWMSYHRTAADTSVPAYGCR